MLAALTGAAELKGGSLGDALPGVRVRAVARFFTTADVFLTPPMSTPPLPIGTMYSTPEDPWRSRSTPLTQEPR